MTDTAKHTPGPWAVEFGTTLVWGPAPSHDTRDWGSSLAAVLHDTTLYGRTIDIHEAKANASLIAAAPDLLEALKELIEALRKEAPGTALNNHRFDAIGLKANNAIDKAEGRS